MRHKGCQMDLFFELHGEWENQVVTELYAEYRHILRERRLSLRSAAIEIIDSGTHWGQWDAQTRTIQISRTLLTSHEWFHVVAVLRHEMAHQLVDESEDQGMDQRPHGLAFQWACQRLGVPQEFSKAQINLQENDLDWRKNKRDDESEKMLEKVRKLLALATSANEHEALLAMNRVREIYSKYNLDQMSGGPKSKFFHIVISRGSKRIEAHERRIVSILVEYFFVEVITGHAYDIRKGHRHKTIEIIGTRENALMAEYVYHFLVQQSELMVDEVVKNHGRNLSRITKKSYRLGILAGFAEKLRTSEKKTAQKDPEATSDSLISKALVAFKGDGQLDAYIGTVYPRLSKRQLSGQRIDNSAYQAGVTAGQKITLNKPVTSTPKYLGKILG